MFEIDLKTSAVRRPPAAGASRSGPGRSLVPVAGALAGLVGALWLIGHTLEQRIARRETEVSILSKAVEDARVRLAEVSGKRREMLAFAREEVYWSDQLRALSRRLEDKLWIDRVKMTTASGAKGSAPSRRLEIEGGVLSGGNEGNLDLIAGFVDGLGSDERFRQAFADVRLASVQRAGSDSITLKFVLHASVRL